MFDLGEFLRRRRADLTAQRLGIDEFGMRGFQRIVAAAQRIVFRVGNGRRVFAMIAPVMLGDLGAELRIFRANGGEGELFGRWGSDRSRSCEREMRRR